jgi:hypothetical protein
MKPTQGRPRRAASTAGTTLVELLIASAIMITVTVSLYSVAASVGRMEKSVFFQQRSIKDSRSVIENINREIRLASGTVQVYDTDGDPAARGNVVEFARAGEATGTRSFELISTDDDLFTPGDNTLVFDPDTGADGDEIVLATFISPANESGAFAYTGATEPLLVNLRIGDPVFGDGIADANRVTGVNIQGVDINLLVSPRN